MGSAVVMALSAKQQHSAAKTTETHGKLRAEMEDVAAKQREVDRKEQLINSISTIRASSAGAGIDPGVGSPLTMIAETVRQEERDTARDKFNARMRATTEIFRSRARAGQLRGEAALSLIEAGDEIAGSIK